MTGLITIPRAGASSRPFGFAAGELVEGSLCYIEPARDGLKSADLVAGATFRNWCRGYLSDLTGAALEDATIAAMNIGGGFGREVTSAGALHGYFDTSSEGATQGMTLSLPDDVLNYTDANQSNDYYVDAIVRPTLAPALGAANSYQWIWAIDKGTYYSLTNAFVGVGHRAISGNTDAQNTVKYPPTSSLETLLSAVPTLTVGALHHGRFARVGVPADWDRANTEAGVFWSGPVLGSDLSGGLSFIFYSLYMEDITVSGRTPAEVYAWRAARAAPDFAPGGRYDGETWTDPATVVW